MTPPPSPPPPPLPPSPPPPRASRATGSADSASAASVSGTAASPAPTSNAPFISPSSSLATQFQIRQNSEEYAAILQDLHNWENRVCGERKISALESSTSSASSTRSSSASNPASAATDAAENSSLLSASTCIKQNSFTQTAPTARKSRASTDYAAWDKFNDEDELGDTPKVKPTSRKKENIAAKSNVLPSQPTADARDLAELSKEAGNVYFRKARYTKAVEHYTRAIVLVQNQPIYYVNRAKAHFRAGDAQAAERDCTDALAIDKNNVKALYTRAMAREQQDDLVEALADIERGRTLNPLDKDILSAYERLQSRLRRRKLHVRDITPTTNSTSASSSSSCSSSSSSSSSSSTSLSPSQKSKQHSSQPPSNSGQANLKPRQNNLDLVDVNAGPTHDISQSLAALKTNLSSSETKLPVYSYELDRTLRQLQTPVDRCEYILKIAPRRFGELLGYTFDADLLGVSLAALYECTHRKDAGPRLLYNYIYFISRIPRLASLLSLLDEVARRRCRQIFEYLEESLRGDASVLVRLSRLKSIFAQITC